MLKSSNERDINLFTTKVINFFNPKFENDTEAELARVDIFSFAMRCELTSEEFLLALNLATEGKLKTDPDKDGNAENIKLYREIDIIKLGEIKAAYMRFKIENEKYLKGKAEIKAYLNPPAKEMTPEELKKLILENVKKDYHRFNADGRVLASPLFYDLIKKKRGDKIRLQFVEEFLKNFVPEVAEGKLTPKGSTQLPKIIKRDVYLEFQNEIIKQYISHLKLNEQTEAEWLKHWEGLYELNQV